MRMLTCRGLLVLASCRGLLVCTTSQAEKAGQKERAAYAPCWITWFGVCHTRKPEACSIASWGSTAQEVEAHHKKNSKWRKRGYV